MTRYTGKFLTHEPAIRYRIKTITWDVFSINACPPGESHPWCLTSDGLFTLSVKIYLKTSVCFQCSPQIFNYIALRIL